MCETTEHPEELLPPEADMLKEILADMCEDAQRESGEHCKYLIPPDVEFVNNLYDLDAEVHEELQQESIRHCQEFYEELDALAETPNKTLKDYAFWISMTFYFYHQCDYGPDMCFDWESELVNGFEDSDLTFRALCALRDVKAVHNEDGRYDTALKELDPLMDPTLIHRHRFAPWFNDLVAMIDNHGYQRSLVAVTIEAIEHKLAPGARCTPYIEEALRGLRMKLLGFDD